MKSSCARSCGFCTVAEVKDDDDDDAWMDAELPEEVRNVMGKDEL